MDALATLVINNKDDLKQGIEMVTRNNRLETYFKY